ARLDRPGDRTQAPAARGRRPDVVLREVQPQAVRGVLLPRRPRKGLRAGVRALLRLARTQHPQAVPAPAPGAGEVRGPRHPKPRLPAGATEAAGFSLFPDPARLAASAAPAFLQ